ncbi:MAG TPA: CCA tRNA nucleotidyltransferase [Candidatus Dormibacteraeota bacterium]|jgi:tRNA nucleotidyltransferase/poly(A) polymerase|nr:CCA tRNA nucleotidyltransferase [Candidatus Dormibacteraeota bacterium]
MKSPMEKTARDVAARLRERGHLAYFAGGCVRDIVRGETPKDFDIATDANPEAVQKLFPHTYAVGAHFGVILVVENGFQFEVATFRADDVYVDGRRPSAVHFSSPEEDARRRDFTINGMFYDPVAEKVIDFVGGRADIQAKLVRAIGDPGQRFAEDRLRMLRAVRFATVLDYKIDRETWDALLANVVSINEISAERIREELVRMFLSSNRTRGWDLLDSSGLMRAILPEIDAMKGCAQPEQFHPEGDVFEHTRLMLQFLPEKVSVPLVFGVLLHDVAKPRTATVDNTGRIRFNEHDRIGAEMTEEIMRRLRFSGAEIDATVEMVRQHMVFKDVPKMRMAKLKRFMARPTFDDELELHRVDCQGSHRMLDNYEFLLRKREEFANEPIIPPPLVRGDDLIALGLKPSPKFGEILEAVETRQLEGTLRTREEALEWVKHEYSLGEDGRTQ